MKLNCTETTQIAGVNHVTLSVIDLETSLHFYTDILEMQAIAEWNNGAYLLAGELWVCLAEDEFTVPCSERDSSHIALDVKQTDFESMRSRIAGYGVDEWKENKSEGDSFYFLDPNGHKLEIHVGNIWTRIADMKRNPYPEMEIYEDARSSDNPGDHALCLTSDGVNFRCWKIENLWKYASELPVLEIEIASLPEFANENEKESFNRNELAQKAKRIMKADLSFPIILSSEGWMFDGGHRTMKAVSLGLTTIRAVRFTVDPEPDYWRRNVGE